MPGNYEKDVIKTERYTVSYIRPRLTSQSLRFVSQRHGSFQLGVARLPCQRQHFRSCSQHPGGLQLVQHGRVGCNSPFSTSPKTKQPNPNLQLNLDSNRAVSLQGCKASQRWEAPRGSHSCTRRSKATAMIAFPPKHSTPRPSRVPAMRKKLRNRNQKGRSSRSTATPSMYFAFQTGASCGCIRDIIPVASVSIADQAV
jgi:hypothetical protein